MKEKLKDMLARKLGKLKRRLKSWYRETFCKKAIMIEKLNEELVKLNEELSAKDAQMEIMKKRFMRLGDQIETMDKRGPALQTIIKEIDIEPIQFGDYLAMSMLDSNREYQDVVFEEAKGRMAEKLATGLIENNLVQFIIRDQNHYDPLNMFTTVAAKITVVPWEQMAIGRRIRMTVRR